MNEFTLAPTLWISSEEAGLWGQTATLGVPVEGEWKAPRWVFLSGSTLDPVPAERQAAHASNVLTPSPRTGALSIEPGSSALSLVSFKPSQFLITCSTPDPVIPPPPPTPLTGAANVQHQIWTHTHTNTHTQKISVPSLYIVPPHPSSIWPCATIFITSLGYLFINFSSFMEGLYQMVSFVALKV